MKAPEPIQEGYGTCAEGLPDIVWGARPDGFVEYVNARAVAYTGLPAEQLQGWGWRKVIHPQDVPRAQTAWAQATRSGNPYQAEYRLRSKDGAYRWHLARALPMRAAPAGAARWAGTCTDIDEPLRAAQGRERALARQRQTRVAAVAAQQARHHARLQLAIQAANVGLWDWDLQTQAVYLSPEAKRQLGYGEAELMAATFGDWAGHLHPEDRPRMAQQLQAYLAQPWPGYEAEFRLRHKDGSYRWVLARAELVYDAAGKPWRMLGCQLDITERKGAEEALRQSEERFATFMDNLPGFAWLKDVQGRYVYLNKRVTQLPSYGANWLGKTDAELWPADLAPSTTPTINRSWPLEPRSKRSSLTWLRAPNATRW
jgi:PAS domain S-box-containing protein